MFSFENLDEENYLLYAAKAYDKPNALMSEFDDDIKRIKYVKRLLRRFNASGNLKERLILNHLIVLNNVFGPEVTTRLLFLKIDKREWVALKTFLTFLALMPPIVKGIKGKDLRSSDIQISTKIANVLRSI